MATNQTQKAVEAFQKQIAANPYDGSAYSELGQAYAQQQKYDDAITQFKKQIEINPLDPTAHASLGFLYITLKRFNEAVPELEKAVSVPSNNPLLLASLGQAYLGDGQTQKGMASFDKAIIWRRHHWSGITSPTRWPNRTPSSSAPKIMLTPPSALWKPSCAMSR